MYRGAKSLRWPVTIYSIYSGVDQLYRVTHTALMWHAQRSL
jgi:hypothetical protein